MNEERERQRALFELLNHHPECRKWSSKRLGHKLGIEAELVEKYRQQWKTEHAGRNRGIHLMASKGSGKSRLMGRHQDH